MNLKDLIEKLVNLYHHDFNSRTLICWEENKIVIKWYSEEYKTETIETNITDKKDGVNLYDELCEYINFIELAYELECIRKN